ncbi:hypothetical protein, partial [Salmonella enterica]
LQTKNCQPISGLVSLINKKVVLPAISKIDHTNQSANGRLGLQTSTIHGQPASHNPPASGQTQDLAF